MGRMEIITSGIKMLRVDLSNALLYKLHVQLLLENSMKQESYLHLHMDTIGVKELKNGNRIKINLNLK